MSKMETLCDADEEKSTKSADTLLKGLSYAQGIYNSFTILINMSANLEKVVTKSSLLSLCHLIELLKAIQITYHKKKEFIAFALQNITQALTNRLLSFVMAAKVIIQFKLKFTENNKISFQYRKG
jgi:WASH complex subunit 7